MNILLAILVFAAIVALLVDKRRRQAKAMRRSFSELTFDTPEGQVKGDALSVVKVAALSASTPNSVEGFATDTRDEFWYCVGPGPSYFLAIPTVGSRYGFVAFVRWVIRPLSEERMRAALQGDRRASKLAFA